MECRLLGSFLLRRDENLCYCRPAKITSLPHADPEQMPCARWQRGECTAVALWCNSDERPCESRTSADAGEAKAAWTQALCTAIADAQLSSSKKLARHALQAMWGSLSAYRDAKFGIVLQQQSQVRLLGQRGRL